MGKRTVTKYTEEFKKSSAKLANESEQPITDTAQDLGINNSTLHGWVKKYYPTGQAEKSTQASTEQEQEIKRLRKENARLKQERDILKKATACFASAQV